MKTQEIALIAMLCAALLHAPAMPAAASAPQKPEEARALIRSVIMQQAHPDSKIEYRWVRRAQKTPPQEEKSPWLEALFRQLEGFLNALTGLRQVGAIVGRSGVLMALAAGLLLYLIYSKRFIWLTAPWSDQPAPARQPEMLFGLDVRPESLPAAPDQASLELLAAGKRRESLALLYRAALSRFMHDHQVELHPSLTELECEKRIARQGQRAQSGYFRRLTLYWLRSAYGHEQLDDALHHQLAQGWKEAFG